MCLICMKYRIIFLIIIIISLGQILLPYIANTSRTDARTHIHACARTRANACTHTAVAVSLFGGSWPANRDAHSAGDNSWSLAIEINAGGPGTNKYVAGACRNLHYFSNNCCLPISPMTPGLSIVHIGH